MLSKRENFLETIRGGKPDRFVKQYEFLHLLVPDTYYMGNYPIVPGSPDGVDQFGVTWTLPIGQMGAFPRHDDEHRVLKDITKWRDVLEARVPDPSTYPEEEWDAVIVKACEYYHEYLQRKKARDR